MFITPMEPAPKAGAPLDCRSVAILSKTATPYVTLRQLASRASMISTPPLTPPMVAFFLTNSVAL